METTPGFKLSEIRQDGPVEMLRIPSLDSQKPNPFAIENLIPNPGPSSTVANVSNNQGLQMKSKQVDHSPTGLARRRSRKSKYNLNDTREPYRAHEPTTIVMDRHRPHEAGGSNPKRYGAEAPPAGLRQLTTEPNPTHGSSNVGALSSSASSASIAPIEDQTRDSKAKTSQVAPPQLSQQQQRSKSRDLARGILTKSRKKQEADQSCAPIPDSQDKGPLLYSWKHLELALARCMHAGHLTMFAFWLSFLLFTVVVDYMKLEKRGLFDVVQAVDVGTISNMDAGLFGWLITLIVILLIYEVFKEFLSSRHPCMVVTVGVIIVLVYAIIMMMYILGQIWQNKGVRPNAYLVLTHLIIWLLWMLYATYQLSMTVFAMEDPNSFPASAI